MRKTLMINIISILCWVNIFSQSQIKETTGSIEILDTTITNIERKILNYENLINILKDSIIYLEAEIPKLRQEKRIAEKNQYKKRINEKLKANIQVKIKNKTHIYSEPTYTSTKKRNLKSGAYVRLLERDQEAAYYKIEYKRIIGYVFIDFLDLPEEIKYNERQLARFIDDESSRKLKEGSNLRRESTGDSAGTYSGSRNSTYKSSGCNSVQCSGRTKKGNRCKNITTNCNGRCHLH